MLTKVLLLVLSFVFSAMTSLLLVRFLMQWLRIPFHNQIGRFIVAATNWLVLPLRRVIPGLFGMDIASLLLAWALQTGYVSIELGLYGMLNGSAATLTFALCGLGLIALLRVAVYLMIAGVLISALFSWINPHAPMASFFFNVTAPLLRPFRRLIPPVANVDLSPLLLLLILQIISLVLGELQTGVMQKMLLV